MNKKRVLGLVLATSLIMSGCSGVSTANSSVKDLRDMSPLNSESQLKSKDYKLSYAEKQDLLYEQVSARTLLDFSHLTACTTDEVEQTRRYLDSVDNQLVGNIDPSIHDIEGKQELPINECFTNYLLCMFEQTPYYWQRTKTVIKGVDPDSKTIIADVTYKTIDFRKDISVDSSIILGEPNYEKKIKNRFDKWLQICDVRLNNPSHAELPVWQKAFTEYYGDVDKIIAEQRTKSLTANIYETGNQTTHSGLTNTASNSGATMTVRYILVPNYVLGVNLGITCKHMYVTDFKLTKDPTPTKIFKEEGYQTITDTVFALMYSYFQCIDECDYSGLYKLTKDFSGMDKYYKDLFETTYTKHEGFTIGIFDIQGTKIKCGVQVSTKSRAKGSNMTYPIYIDKYLCDLELVDDQLKVVNINLIERKLVGEPSIESDSADIQGFGGVIDLGVGDKKAIEDLLVSFGRLQLRGDTTSDRFSETVDITQPQSQINELKENLTSMFSENLQGNETKVVYLTNYMQGTPNYAQVKCRELYQYADNSITEAITTYEFINVGGYWKVYSFNINSTVKLDTTTLTTVGSLAKIGPGDELSLTTQVKSDKSESLDNAADVSIALNHDEYKPTIKKGIREQGKLLYTAENMNNAEMFNKVIESYAMQDRIASYEAWDETFNLAITSIQSAEIENASDIITSLQNIRQAQLFGMATAMNKASLYMTEQSDLLQAMTDFEGMVTLDSDYIRGQAGKFDSDVKGLLQQILTYNRDIEDLFKIS